MSTHRFVVSFLATLVVAGCGIPQEREYWGDRRPEGTTGLTAVDDPEDQSDVPNLGRWVIPYTAPDPNVMLVVDRSGSMNSWACAGEGCTTRWNSLLALGDYLAQVKSSARLGLTVYPSSAGACVAPAEPTIAVTDDPEIDRRIMDVVTSTIPGGSTPTAAALDSVRVSGQLDDPARDNVVVLLTDGTPNCACEPATDSCDRAEAVAAVERLVNERVPIKFFAIGFGVTPESEAERTLQAMAAAAAPAFAIGEANSAPSYFSASSVDELVARLYSVAFATQPCGYELQADVAADDLVVSLDGDELPACGGNCAEGFSYDEQTRTVELADDTCAYLRNGAPHELWFGDRSHM